MVSDARFLLARSRNVLLAWAREEESALRSHILIISAVAVVAAVAGAWSGSPVGASAGSIESPDRARLTGSSETVGMVPIVVPFDIEPGVCPNGFNPWIPLLQPEPLETAIAGTDDVPAANIRIESLVLVVPEGGGGLRCEVLVYPIATRIEDTATPFVPVDCECIEGGADGADDLVIEFSSAEVAAALAGVVPGDEVVLRVRGTLMDGTPFEGRDCVLIVSPTSIDGDSWGRVKTSYRE